MHRIGSFDCGRRPVLHSPKHFSFARACAFLAMTAVCLVAIQPAYAQVDAAESKPSKPDAAVLIFPIRTSGVELSDPAKQELVRYLGTRLTIERVYNVMPEAQIQKELGAAKIESYKDCYEESCRIELGRAIMADKSLSVDITSEKGHCRITATIYDLKKEMSESAGDTQAGCRLEDLRAGMKVIAEQLSGKAGLDQAVGYGLSGTGVTESGTVSGGIAVDLGETIVNKATDQMGFLTVKTHRKGDTKGLNGEFKDAGAMILLNGKEIRPSPILEELMVGDYVVVARLDDYYHAATKRIQLGKAGVTVDLELMPAFGTLTIATEPADSEILINDRPVNKAVDGRPYIDNKVKSGAYRIDVRRGLYKPIKRLVTVTDGLNTSESFRLEPDFGNIDVTSQPAGATVFLDGKEVGRTFDEKTPLHLVALSTGVYSLRVVKEYHLPEDRKVKVGDGLTVAEAFALKTDFGGLRIASVPEGAAIILDDKPTNKVTPARLSLLKPGVHFIALEKDGYGRAVDKATVVDGRDVEVNLVMQPKLGMLSVMAEKEDRSPCDGEVMVDGKPVGLTPWKGDVLAVKHKVEVKCAEGVGATTVTVPHNGRESVTVNVGNRGRLIVESVYQDGSSCRGKLKINGAEIGQTPWDEWVDSGKYFLRVDCPDGVGEADVGINRADRKTVKVEVSGRPVYSPWPWVTLGLGAAAIVGGGMLNLFADIDLTKVSDATDPVTGLVTGMTLAEARSLEDKANMKNDAAIAMYSIGSAAALTGLIWGIVDVVKVKSTRHKTRSKAQISGILIPGGGGIGIAGAF